mgnify:CR=1 FL=1
MSVSMKFGQPNDNNTAPNLHWELLWENDDPSASFAAQTIDLDLVSYYLVMVEYRMTSANTSCLQAPVGSALNMIVVSSNSSNRTGYRTATINNDGIVFSNCTYNNATSNNYSVPLRIWATTSVPGGSSGGGGSSQTVYPSSTTPIQDTSGGVVGEETFYARGDHAHQLNVATSGTPSMDGTASLGSADTYARTDHVHPTDTSKQDTLVSGTNIKTINNNSLLGSGNITISGGGADPATATPLMDGNAAVGTATKYAREDHVHPKDTSKQDTLVSGTNIKTINNTSLLGSGNISIGGGGTIEPATALPLQDGTAAVGTSTKYAREDHVHPKAGKTWLIKNGRNAISWTTGSGMVIQETAVDSVTFTGTATGYHYAYYAVDLTNIKTIMICCAVSASSSAKVNGFAVWEPGTSLGNANNVTSGVRKWSTPSSGGAIVWDVSDLSGTYWVGVAATYTDKVYVTTFFME